MPRPLLSHNTVAILQELRIEFSILALFRKNTSGSFWKISEAIALKKRITWVRWIE
jgi:hypothetical protein